MHFICNTSTCSCGKMSLRKKVKKKYLIVKRNRLVLSGYNNLVTNPKDVTAFVGLSWEFGDSQHSAVSSRSSLNVCQQALVAIICDIRASLTPSSNLLTR